MSRPAGGRRGPRRASSDFNPAPLVARGIIVVTLNYRLGALGFLTASALTGKSAGSGDYGLLDQQAALRWVRANIAAFGGDRRAVTLAGESAGGLSVLAQLASPAARGLFSRAIAESGTYQLDQDTQAQADSSGAAFAAKAGCAANTATRAGQPIPIFSSRSPRQAPPPGKRRGRRQSARPAASSASALPSP